MRLKIFTIGEAKEYLQIHRTYVSRLIQEGKLKSIKIGRSYRILEEDLELFIGERINRPLLKVEEVAKTLKIHRLYVIRLIKNKKLKAIKIGKFYRIGYQALIDFMDVKSLSQVLTVEEVAKMLQLNRVTIINLIKEKKLRAFRIGKFYRTTEKMLAGFLKARPVKLKKEEKIKKIKSAKKEKTKKKKETISFKV